MWIVPFGGPQSLVTAFGVDAGVRFRLAAPSRRLHEDAQVVDHPVLADVLVEVTRAQRRVEGVLRGHEIWQSIEEAGRKLVALLMDKLEGRPVESVVLPTELIQRRTTGPMPRR